jgi:hypothetical protein
MYGKNVDVEKARKVANANRKKSEPGGGGGGNTLNNVCNGREIDTSRTENTFFLILKFNFKKIFTH